MTCPSSAADVREQVLDTMPHSRPVWFRGRSHATRKRFWYGTQRVISPRETLDRIGGQFKRVGLTRLADITSLDRIGIPTVLAIRPNGLGLAADAGKGFTLDAAKASAAMECIERFHAETVTLPATRASYEQIAGEHAAIGVTRLPLKKHSLFSVRLPQRWTLAWDLVGQREVAVPCAMVTMNGHVEQAEISPFQGGSNGLASGNTFLEAVAGGLLEVVERDAIACARVMSNRDGGAARTIQLETITHPLVVDLLERFERASMAVVLVDCTVDTAIPVYTAYVYDRQSRHLGIYAGYGAHLDPEIAMVRALTEAVQARAVFIAGSRDDFFRHDYLRLKQADDVAAIERLEASVPQVNAQAAVSSATTTFEGDIQIIIERLRAVGLTEVLVVDLTLPGFDVSAVRVIVPGLEGYLFPEYYSPGRRARACYEEGRP